MDPITSDQPPNQGLHVPSNADAPPHYSPNRPNSPPALPPRRSLNLTPPPSHSSSHSRNSSLSSHTSIESHQDSLNPPPSNLPSSTHPTVIILIPFPPALYPSEKTKKKLPPFVLYAPLAAPFTKPLEGEKEGVVHKAQRKWQTEEREAKEKGSGFKAKAVSLISKGMSATKNSKIEFLVRTPNKSKLKELRIIYPASYTSENIKEMFVDTIKKAKSGAIRNGVISTAMLPFVLTFDVLTFITGPFEINAVWAASSWTGAARASAISSRITSSELPITLTPDEKLDVVAYRLHEICWRKVSARVARPRSVIEVPRWGEVNGGRRVEGDANTVEGPPVGLDEKTPQMPEPDLTPTPTPRSSAGMDDKVPRMPEPDLTSTSSTGPSMFPVWSDGETSHMPQPDLPTTSTPGPSIPPARVDDKPLHFPEPSTASTSKLPTPGPSIPQDKSSHIPEPASTSTQVARSPPPQTRGPIKRGPDLAGVLLQVLEEHGEDMSSIERSRTLVGEDLERCLKKGVKEWVKVVT
ncbi:hypothetical protein JAAARDRAFT_206947 [Jaapia argillacea MUCL 33604]|uniref:Uncharacterized protein n=1 Tax=Jaapia argillacea MUCL 33604 TaxID=933084 RepID=A0A067PRI7_9AGAM|nr:hypothetical protein JAAARDRAFT_206947 [Jaapia argillacea MUCL 33604]